MSETDVRTDSFIERYRPRLLLMFPSAAPEQQPQGERSRDAVAAVAECDEDDEMNIPDEFLCPICFNLLLDPVSPPRCQHLFCGPCLRRHRQGRLGPYMAGCVCPMCRSAIGPTEPLRPMLGLPEGATSIMVLAAAGATPSGSIPPFLAALASTRVFCPAQGCDYVGSYLEFTQQHRQNCSKIQEADAKFIISQHFKQWEQQQQAVAQAAVIAAAAAALTGRPPRPLGRGRIPSLLRVPPVFAPGTPIHELILSVGNSYRVRDVPATDRCKWSWVCFIRIEGRNLIPNEAIPGPAPAATQQALPSVPAVTGAPAPAPPTTTGAVVPLPPIPTNQAVRPPLGRGRPPVPHGVAARPGSQPPRSRSTSQPTPLVRPDGTTLQQPRRTTLQEVHFHMWSGAIIIQRTSPFEVKRIGWGEFPMFCDVLTTDGLHHRITIDLKLYGPQLVQREVRLRADRLTREWDEGDLTMLGAESDEEE